MCFFMHIREDFAVLSEILRNLTHVEEVVICMKEVLWKYYGILFGSFAGYKNQECFCLQMITKQH